MDEHSPFAVRAAALTEAQHSMLLGGAMDRIGTTVLLACGLQCMACEMEEPFDADSTEEAVILDQVVPVGDVGPAGPPATPQEESAVIGPTNLLVRITNMAGPGCARRTHLVRSGNTPASNVEIFFEEDDFGIDLAPSGDGTETRASLNCLLELRVRGIARHQAVSTHIGYSGNRNLAIGAFGKITSRVMWRDAEFAMHSATKEEESFDVVGAWIMEHSMRATDKGVRSRCFSSGEEEDVFYVDISMGIRNSSDRSAKMSLTWTSMTSNGRPGTQKQPPIAAMIQVQPCTP